jgi:hypothetical protein
MGWIDNNTNIDPNAKEGLRIRMIDMDDQYGVDEGMEGTIIRIDDLGTIHVKWDDGSTLGVIPGIDKYELLPSPEDQIGFDDIFKESSDPKPVLRGAKSTSAGKTLNKNFKSGLRKGHVRDIKVESEEVAGGEAEGMTTKDLAKKHSVSVKDIEKELEVGTEIEMEHTDSKKMAREIAMDHVAEFPDYYTNKKYGVKASEKGLEKDLEETTTAGAAGAYSAPLFGKPQKRNESTIIKVKDLVNEVSTLHSSKLRDKPGAIDGDAWVGKNGWQRKDELAWEGGEIADILAKLDINWNDSDLTLTDKQTDKINEAKKATIHTKKWERCVKDVEEKNKENKTDYNPYAVCQKSIGYEGSIKKPHRKKEKEDIEETTTFSSVWGVNGPPVGPIAFAKKGKHQPSKKPIWKGGQIIQKITKHDLLEEINEVNKVKWVKGGKFVKIKDKCAKYNNQPHCSQGAIDDPLELSDTTFENIKKVSEKLGVSEQEIINRILENNNQLPTQKMKDWFNFSYNKPSETMDELELDEFYSKMKQDFIDDFSSELSGLTYMEMCRLFDDLAY